MFTFKDEIKKSTNKRQIMRLLKTKLLNGSLKLKKCARVNKLILEKMKINKQITSTIKFKKKEKPRIKLEKLYKIAHYLRNSKFKFGWKKNWMNPKIKRKLKMNY